MGKWYVGFDGRWRESFHDEDEALEWAQEVAEREIREAIWKAGWRMHLSDGS